ncbi:hypothetical protein PNI0008_00416 [Streptococcus pneumoniae PNI0008]|nr:hypothetical protein PNI0008_00416 [Streptococcus pneumoniae PNI0008]
MGIYYLIDTNIPPCFLFRSQTNLLYHYLLETSVNRDHLVQNMLKLPVGFFHQ